MKSAKKRFHSKNLFAVKHSPTIKKALIGWKKTVSKLIELSAMICEKCFYY